ncbi:MAG: aldehyde dehydrogenase, partial [Rhodobacteraceae bacterium]|nr:aldehyde dehydrogenase [Paracoccaceae bacterium]
MTVKVLINGFGRIGRTVLRAWLRGDWPKVDVVAINDITDAQTCAYLFEYDSVFGVYPGQVALEEGALMVDGR